MTGMRTYDNHTQLHTMSGVVAVTATPPCVPAQAEALPWLCSQLRLGEGLRELFVDLHGKATNAVPNNFAEVGRLTQLETLQLQRIAVDASREQLSAALSPLTGLTRLDLRFDNDAFDRAEGMPSFPLEATVCGLTNLQELYVSSDTYQSYHMLTGALSGALSQLTTLRRLDIDGMQECGDIDHSDELQLAALPVLETAALLLHTRCGHYPSLSRVQQVTLSRVVSLSLALLYDEDETYDATYLPAIIAPALTELVWDEINLAPESEQLSWLPDLPQLRRLVLTDVSTASSQLPQGVLACSGLRELVVERFLIGCSMQGQYSDRPAVRLRSFPAAGAHLSQLVRLGLSGNALSAVPPCLAAATLLEVLDMGKQRLGEHGSDQHGKPLHGLEVLNGLSRLRYANFFGFHMSAADYRLFQVAHPELNPDWNDGPRRYNIWRRQNIW